MIVFLNQIYRLFHMLAISTEFGAVKLIQLSKIMEKKNKVLTLIPLGLVIYNEIYF